MTGFAVFPERRSCSGLSPQRRFARPFGIVAKPYPCSDGHSVVKEQKEPMHRNTKRRDNYLALKSVSM